jgi:formylglycine-generating enzyme required for sulfatase activity
MKKTELSSHSPRRIWPIATWALLYLALSGPFALGEISLSLVTVGDAGNPPDATGYGGVDSEYRIGRYEVTNSQYAAFLNAVAAADTYELYNAAMSIARAGSAGSYTYSTAAGSENEPVCCVSFFDALRFANWLHNGQPAGEQDATTTEDGAYTFTAATAVGARNPGARFWLPSEDQWYKAAYYRGGSSAGYWLYPTQSDTAPAAAAPAGTGNTVNYDHAVGGVTEVGSYPASPAHYGTLDQAGNVWEWNEQTIGADRGLRGGSWDDYELLLDAWYRDSEDPTSEYEFVGFRIAAGVQPFRRGNVNGDKTVDISDAIATLSYLFLGHAPPTCLSAADTNDDGALDISDGVTLLSYLFVGQASLPPPFAECGLDPTADGLSCESFPRCGGQ